ncbi:uncharacterized protein LOC118462570 isoform X1 [Anopheles albimanus]|uniref:uncharacterized protein LOC118462570 isoform X1 n=1 Tax=Anopheles albimanus TaxID=7167 RepID=UPI00163E66E8|nr:uncharacterized protein LOC118462570 isoform X1 [Anopheles albimanus]
MNAYEQQHQPSLELTAKRYPIAAKNRKSKFQFLAGVQEHYERKKEAAKERAAAPKRVNLSVPGTPVCSRYLQSLSSRSSVASSDDESTREAVPPAQELIISSIVLEKFVKEMKTLSSADQQPDKAASKAEENVNVQHDDTTDSFFKTSDARQAYHRTFSEAVGTVGGPEKDPAVKKYFEESASQHTYRRDFSEAYGELGGVKDDPIFSTTTPSSAATTKKKKRSKPSRQQLISESSSDEDQSGAPELAARERQRNDFLEELMELKNSKKRMEEELKAFQSKDPLATGGQKERVQTFFERSDQSKAYHRSFSEAAQTFGAPPSDPKVREYFSESATRHTYRRDFSEVCGELGANGPATSESERYKPTVPGTPISSRNLHKLKKRAEEEPERMMPDASTSLTEQLAKFNEELEELKLSKPAISLDPKQPPKVTDCTPPEKPEFCVDQYLNTSNEKRSYARSFSEAAQSLNARPEVKSDTVKSFFDDSSRKGTFRREFSQAYQELANPADDVPTVPGDVTQPDGGTSADRTVATVEDNGAIPSLPDKAMAVVAEERNIAIPGTPVSSRKRSPPKPAVRSSDKPIVPEASRTSGTWDGQRLPARVPLTPQLDGRKQFTTEKYFATKFFKRARSFSGKRGDLTDNDDDNDDHGNDGNDSGMRTGRGAAVMRDDREFVLAGSKHPAGSMGHTLVSGSGDKNEEQHQHQHEQQAQKQELVTTFELDKEFWRQFSK